MGLVGSNWDFRWRYGLLGQPGGQAIEPFLGTRAQLGFIATIIVQSIIVLTMVAIAFGLVESNLDPSDKNAAVYDNKLKTLPCYFAMFGLAEVFELIMGLDALKLRNIIQLIGILIFHAMLVVSAGLQIHQTRTALVDPPGVDGLSVNPTDTCLGEGYKTCSGPDGLYALVSKFLIVVPVILGASLLGMMYFVRELYHEFGWAVFHAIGADPRMKEMYQWYQIMICLLKFDFFCFVALTMQLLIVVLNKSSVEFGLTVAAIPVVLLLLIACGIAVKREVKWLMTGSLILMLGAQAYFLYKFSRLFIGKTRWQYVSTRATLATVSIIAFLMIFASFAVGLRCFADFDKGLKKSKTQDVEVQARPAKMPFSPVGTPGMDQRNSYMLEPRMSIE